MTRTPPTASDLEALELAYPGMEVSWAGEGPRAELLCIGFDNGAIRFENASGERLNGPVLHAVPSQEAVNGVAFLGDSMAITTRADIVVCKNYMSREVDIRVQYPAGAHGIIASSGGEFVAPVGPNGLLFMSSHDEGPPLARTLQRRTRDLYFYKVAQIGTHESAPALACASRLDGFSALAVTPFGNPTHARGFKAEGVDFVGVCPISVGRGKSSFVALASDCSLHFLRDPFGDERPLSCRISGLQGTAYDVAEYGGHLFLLTSAALYILPHYARVTPDRGRGGFASQVYYFVSQGFDMRLAFNRWLLVIEPERTLISDLSCFSLPEEGVDGLGSHNGAHFLHVTSRFAEEVCESTTELDFELAPLG